MNQKKLEVHAMVLAELQVSTWIDDTAARAMEEIALRHALSHQLSCAAGKRLCECITPVIHVGVGDEPKSLVGNLLPALLVRIEAPSWPSSTLIPVWAISGSRAAKAHAIYELQRMFVFYSIFAADAGEAMNSVLRVANDLPQPDRKALLPNGSSIKKLSDLLKLPSTKSRRSPSRPSSPLQNVNFRGPKSNG